MSPIAKKKFVDLVTKVASGKTARSENDLSSQLASYLQSLGLATVVDTSGGARGRKRPDIRAYSSATNADLVLPAEIVIESKKPGEVKAYPNLRAAVVADEIWEEKTLPYVRENLEKIRYFVLTTFVSFAVVEITADLRRQFAELNDAGSKTEIKKAIAKVSLEFVLTHDVPASSPNSSEAWDVWCKSHLSPKALEPLPLSEILNVAPVSGPGELQDFASRLADVAAGSSEGGLHEAGLFFSIRRELGDAYDPLPATAKRDLQIFLMTQHPGTDLAAIEAHAREHASGSNLTLGALV